MASLLVKLNTDIRFLIYDQLAQDQAFNALSDNPSKHKSDVTRLSQTCKAISYEIKGWSKARNISHNEFHGILDPNSASYILTGANHIYYSIQMEYVDNEVKCWSKYHFRPDSLALWYDFLDREEDGAGTIRHLDIDLRNIQYDPDLLFNLEIPIDIWAESDKLQHLTQVTILHNAQKDEFGREISDDQLHTEWYNSWIMGQDDEVDTDCVFKFKVYDDDNKLLRESEIQPTRSPFVSEYFGDAFEGLALRTQELANLMADERNASMLGGLKYEGLCA